MLRDSQDRGEIRMLISPIQLDETIQIILEESVAELKDKVHEEALKIAEDVCCELRKESPKDTKKYSKSWKFKETKSGLGKKGVVIYNEKHYRLTHLLEHGHAKRNGGRVSAVPHIRKANENACKEFERRVKELINEM